MSHYIWNHGLARAAIELGCDWVRPETFNQDKYEYTGRPMIVCDGDETFPTDCHINGKLPELIFAQNYDGTKISGTTVVPIPIGVDYHTIENFGGWKEPRMSWDEQERQLESIYWNSQPFNQRSHNLFVDFHHSDTMQGGFEREKIHGENRTQIYGKIKKTGLVVSHPFMRRSDLWKVKAQSRFSVCPHGNGLDTHRTWETLILGCMPIVKTSPLDVLYDGLPVIIVKSWDEITRDNLYKWMGQYHLRRENLTTQHWINKILEAMNVAV